MIPLELEPRPALPTGGCETCGHRPCSSKPLPCAIVDPCDRLPSDVETVAEQVARDRRAYAGGLRTNP